MKAVVHREGSSRAAARSKRSVKPGAKHADSDVLTNSEGERRAIILGMDYYLKLLAELNTLRALVKEHGLAAAPARAGRRPAR
ncbi:MAG: hypothetical protein AB1515_04900 [Nitrospirota bacterium]